MGFKPETDIGDLKGKVIVVTGGNAGIGAAIVKELVKHNPSKIYICIRRPSNGEELIKQIHETHPDASLEVLQLDLASLESVKQCAAELNSKSSRLDWLFLNAGISATAPGLTKEGYECTFGVNHIGHALLTQLLMPKILATKQQEQGKADVRIMVTSSDASYRMAPKTGLVLGEMRSAECLGWTMVRYGHSKLANVLFARKLAQVYPSINTTSHHPGFVNTEILGKAEGLGVARTLLQPVIWLIAKTVEQGAKTGLWCATTRDFENGAFYEPVGKLSSSKNFNSDQKLTDELWEWTNQELEKHGGPGWPVA